MERIETSTVLYSDLSRNPAASSASLVYNLESIKQSLDNLFNTPYGTRSFQPTYGHTLHYILGEPMTEVTVAEIRARAVESVRLNEPRVKLDSAKTQVTPLYDENAYRIILVFTVSGLSTNDKFSYDIKILNTGDK